MRRRDFMAMLGGAAAWPFPAGAQTTSSGQSRRPTVGFLNNLSPDQWQTPLAGFITGLSKAGFTEGQNVTFVYRWTEGRRDRLPEQAADLARTNVDLIVASADTVTALAARAATSTIPILFVTEDDPVRYGVVSSLDRPGGHATGMYLVKPVSDGAKRQELLRQLAPGKGMFWVMNIFNTSSTIWQTEPEAAFENLLKPPSNPHIIMGAVRAVMVHCAPFLDTRRRSQLVSLAARHRLPTLYEWRSFADEGGLISYGISIEETYAQIGRYAGEILKGRNPGEMPVQKPAKFETVINLKTAAELGLEVSAELLASADKVIEQTR